MDNNIKLDGPRIEEIDSFLKYIYEIKKSNPNFAINEHLVYREMERYGLKEEDLSKNRALSSVEDLFPKWQERYRSHNGIDVIRAENWRYFLQFTNDYFYDDEYLKLYIPIDKNHLYEGANILFDYIESLGVSHVSKIAQEIRSDNVIVRLKKDDYDSAMKIIDFVTNNQYLKNGLNKTNPFIPTVKGIGIMRESGISYNGDMSRFIAAYITESYRMDKNDVSINDFNSWYSSHSYNQELNKIYFNYLAEEKVELSNNKKINLLLDSLIETFKKYGYSHINRALKDCGNGDYGHITRGGRTTPRYRQLLSKYVSSDFIRNYVISTSSKIFHKKYDDYDSAVDDFTNYLFEDALSIMFDSISIVTLEKYGEDHLKTAIETYVQTGYPGFFSRYKSDNYETNYRDLVQRFDRKSTIAAIKKSLRLRNINPDNISDKYLITMYAHELNNSLCNEDINNYAR